MTEYTELPTLLTAAELAEELEYSKARLYALCRSGDIPHIRLGRAIRFDRERVRQWLRDGGTAGASEEG